MTFIKNVCTHSLDSSIRVMDKTGCGLRALQVKMLFINGAYKHKPSGLKFERMLDREPDCSTPDGNMACCDFVPKPVVV